MDAIKNKQLILEELRRVLDKKSSASDVLDGKLQNIFNFISIVVSVAPTLQLMVEPKLDLPGIFLVLLLMLVLILYIRAFRVIVSTVSPVEYRQPISRDWDELSKRYFHETEEDVIKLMISEYLTSSKDADEKNQQKMLAIRKVSILMYWIVVLLLLAVPINLLSL